jgi:hypothetical protein
MLYARVMNGEESEEKRESSHQSTGRKFIDDVLPLHFELIGQLWSRTEMQGSGQHKQTDEIIVRVVDRFHLNTMGFTNSVTYIKYKRYMWTSSVDKISLATSSSCVHP